MSFLSLSDFEINTNTYEQQSDEIFTADQQLFESLTAEQKDVAASRCRYAFSTLRAFGSIDKRLQIVQEADKSQDHKWDKEKKVYLGVFVGLMLLGYFMDFSFLERIVSAIALGVYVLLVSQAQIPMFNRAFNKITTLETAKIMLIRDAESVGVSHATLERLQKCEDMMMNPNSMIAFQFENLHSIVCHQIRIEIMKDVLAGRVEARFNKYLLRRGVNLK
jgi:hypothetical protein